MSDGARARAIGGAALLLSLAAGVMDGGTDPRVSGLLSAACGVLAFAAFVTRPAGATPAGSAPLLAFLVLLCVPRVPWPGAVRRVLAPGQADALARLGGDDGPDAVRRWLEALARADLDAAVGAPTPWTHALLAPATLTTAPGAVDTARWAAATGLVAAMIVCGHAGAMIGRTRRGPRAVAVTLVLAGVGQTLFGLAHRAGGSTGLGAKVHYLGSATGTFVNRGQFAGFLLLALGAAWGLAAMLFPLLPEAIRRHARNPRRSSHPPSVLEASGDKLPRLALLCFSAALIGLGLIAAQSRAALLAAGAAATLVAAWAWRRRGERWHAGLVGTVAAVGAGLSVAAFGVRGAFGRFSGMLGDVSAVSRASLWRESLTAWRDAPLFGHGIGGWHDAWGLHERGPHLFAFGHAHAEWVEWAVDTGAVGVVALGALAWTLGRRVVTGLGATPTGANGGLALGLAFAVLAVAGLGVADFPLRAPGVALPWALTVGLLLGMWGGGARPPATPPGDAPRTRGRPWHLAAAGLLAVVTGTTTARAAWDDPGTRTQRMGDVRAAWRSVDTLPLADALARGEQAAREAPLDPWAHAALGRARTRDAAEAWRVRAPDAERRAFRADQAWARALALRGGAAVRDPRLALARADSLVRLADAGFMADALRARAADLCARAVALDPWRASDAFQVVRAAGMEGIRRVGEAAPAAGGRARARVLTAQGRAFEALGAELPDARRAAADAYAAARRADARYAPGDFAAGELLRRTGDAAGSAAALREAVNGDELGAAMEGWARLHLGEPVRAAARFEAALRHDPGHRWALEGLVEAELAAGDTTDAIRALRRLVAVVPDDVRLRTRLEGLQNPRAGRAAAPVP